MLPYLLDEYGIINVGSDITESVFDFAKRTKKDVKPIRKCKKHKRFSNK